MESAHVLHHCIDELVHQFTSAKFILTIRHPCKWINSEINQNVKIDPNLHWKRVQKKRYVRPPYEFTSYDKELERYNLHPVSKYFQYWARHNTKVLQAIPSDRLLVVRTTDIGNRLSDIADFLDIQDTLLDKTKSHSYKRSSKELNIFELADPEYVKSMALKHCGSLVERFF